MNGYDKTTSFEPLAIVGMACRWPGGATSPEAFWDLLMNKKSAQSDVPPTRFNGTAFHHPDVQRRGTVVSEKGYFLQHDPREFDHSFFGLSPLEAKGMDPQQRQLLEVVYECIESAGIKMEDLSGSDTACMVATFTADYLRMRARDPEEHPAYALPGESPTILSNRISYCFNLKGPSMTIDTACSSSLYALHMAASSIHAGDVEGAIVAGVNLILTPDQSISGTKLGVLSPSSACHTFDESADGYARAEGVGALYIKRLSDALRDGNPVRAVVRGSAINANGKTAGITQPSTVGQEAVIRQAYRHAGIAEDDFKNTGYFEFHGTGTPVGDPVEASAVSKVFSEGREATNPILIGAVKTNLGHSEAASGLAGIMKAVLALEHQLIPPTIGVENLTSKIDFAKLKLKVVTKPTAWPKDAALRASINSFGYGGANSHVVLEAAPDCIAQSSSDETNGSIGVKTPNGSTKAGTKKHKSSVISGFKSCISGLGTLTGAHLISKWIRRSNLPNISKISDQKNDSSQLYLIPFSANNKHSLEKIVSETLDRLREADSEMFGLAVHWLATRQSSMSHKAFAVQNSGREDVVITYGKPTSNPRLALVFTGQGAQWPAMGRELVEAFPLFRRSIQSMDSALQNSKKSQRPNWKIEEMLLGISGADRINEPEFSQTLCTAVQVGLVDLLRSYGVEPVATVGHSSGEITAAYASRRISATEAIVTAYMRGRVVAKGTAEGAMLAVGMSKEDVLKYLPSQGSSMSVVVACENSPSSVTLSGDKNAVDEVKALLDNDKIFNRLLRTGGKAYHSPHMEPLGQQYEACLRRTASKRPAGVDSTRLPMVSSVTGKIVEETVIQPTYWRRNLVSPVLFNQAVTHLLSSDMGLNITHLVEIGPHNALEGPLKQIRTSLDLASTTHYLPSLRRNQNSAVSVLELLGNLFTAGFSVDLQEANAFDGPLTSVEAKRALRLVPSYRWDHTGDILWEESRLSTAWRFREYARHDVLGSRLPDTCGFTWRNVLRANDVSWVMDHRLGNEIVFPGAGYLSLVIEAVSQLHGACSIWSLVFRNVAFKKPMVIPEDNSPVETIVSLQPNTASGTKSPAITYTFTIRSLRGDIWTDNSTGKIGLQENQRMIPNPYLSSKILIIAAPSKLRTFDPTIDAGSSSTWYEAFAKSGLVLTGEFRQLEDVRINPESNHTSASITLKKRPQESRYLIHPTELDSCLQCALICTSSGRIEKLRKAYVPVSISEMIISGEHLNREHPIKACIRAYRNKQGLREVNVDGEVRNQAGDVLVDFSGITCRVIARTRQQENTDRRPFLRSVWKPDFDRLLQGAAGRIFTRADAKYKTKRYALRQCVDLIAHRNPRLRILELGGGVGCLTETIMEELNRDPLMRRYSQYTLALQNQGMLALAEEQFKECKNFRLIDLNTAGQLQDHGLEPEEFDLVIINESVPENSSLYNVLTDLYSSAKSGCYIVSVDVVSIPESSGWAEKLVIQETDERGRDYNLCVLSKTDTKELEKSSSNKITLIYNQDRPDLLSAVEDLLSRANKDFETIKIDDVKTSRQLEHVISFLQVSAFTLSDLNDFQFEVMKYMCNSTKLLWLTSGSPLDGKIPDHGMFPALARTIMSEQPSTHIGTFDVGPMESILDHEGLGKLILGVLDNLRGAAFDSEFALHDGVVHINRLVPDENLNGTFNRQLQFGTSEAQRISAKEGDALNLDFDHLQAGLLDSICFKHNPKAELPLGPTEVEVRISTVGLNMKDVVICMGNHDARIMGQEGAGVVMRVGSDVPRNALQAGDRVVCFFIGGFDTHARMDYTWCQKLKDEEAFEQMTTLPIAYATGILGLMHYAKLRRGETVLIHAAAGGTGIACINLARHIGAKIYATVGSEKKRQFLIHNFGIPAENIFSSRELNFSHQLKARTNGRGVDVIISSVVGELMRESWRCLAPFGRFVDIGRRDVAERGALDLSGFTDTASYASFDLMHYLQRDPEFLSELLKQIVGLFRSAHVNAIQPLRRFPLNELPSAMRYFMQGIHTGKVVIDYEHAASKLQVVPTKKRLTFRDDGTYMIVGGLGGLGRSIAPFMVERGARHLLIMSRSGAGSANAASLVDQLRKFGVKVTIVKGDVSRKEDVARAVKEVTLPIVGVIQAPMHFQDGLFANMDVEAFQKVIRPKVHGTWNVHECTLNQPLDFFILASSIAGTVGTVTQSNYCAANSFKDHFARYRHSLGLPCTSFGIGVVSGVGYVAEHEEVERALTRNGLYTINAQEDFLWISALCGCRW
ncbi:ketoacyl-synt-domain-containing protein [Wilcoxina mikolae CBS 423.85]|nr:ketoacyl-synt-domain-containing protein [Wilcoxina mikolae CBS 423.85]